ncbi:DUF1028 domain-containing protein [Halomonas sp. V046]|uniref:DUF1028 domain-containing protein n=1 Tax=Halomonas sp. V046 TaxID=3459611 RepID=UPI004044BCB6
MTLSLIHVHPHSGTVAAITATGGVAVGGYVHHAWRGLGACVTQGLVTNPWYPDGVRRRLEAGDDVGAALASVVGADAGREQRQCLVMDARGRAALHIGADNLPAVACRIAPGVAVVGNMLADAAVIDALMRCFLDSCCDNAGEVMASVHGDVIPRFRRDYAEGLLETLIEALAAALDAGGDRRGTHSAALRIESFSVPPLDLRVDWAEHELIAELTGLARRVRAPAFSGFLATLPRR